MDPYHNKLDNDVELPGVDTVENMGTNKNPINIGDDLAINPPEPPLVMTNPTNEAVPLEQPGVPAPAVPPTLPPMQDIRQVEVPPNPNVPTGVQHSSRVRTKTQ